MDSDFQTIMNALTVGILVFGEDERILYASRPAGLLFGKTPSMMP
jgi:PAS domain-containing protein